MYGYQGGKGVGLEELGVWDWHIYTIDTMHKIDNYGNKPYRIGNST